MTDSTPSPLHKDQSIFTRVLNRFKRFIGARRSVSVVAALSHDSGSTLESVRQKLESDYSVSIYNPPPRAVTWWDRLFTTLILLTTDTDWREVLAKYRDESGGLFKNPPIMVIWTGSEKPPEDEVKDILTVSLNDADMLRLVNEKANADERLMPRIMRFLRAIFATALALLVFGFTLLNQVPDPIIERVLGDVLGPSDSVSVQTQAAATPYPHRDVIPPKYGQMTLEFLSDDRASLTVIVQGVVSGDAVLNADFLHNVELRFANGMIMLLGDYFDILWDSGGQVAENTCLRFVNAAESSIMPRSCDTQRTFIESVPRAEVYWYDLDTSRLLDFAVYRGNKLLGHCTAARVRCQISHEQPESAKDIEQ